MLIESCREGVLLAVRAFPGAKQNTVRCGDGFLKVYVTQIPEKGKANEAIRKQLVRLLNLRASQVELLQGETSPQKKFLLRNVSAEEVRQRLKEEAGITDTNPVSSCER